MGPLPDRPLPSRPLSEAVVAWLQWFGVVRLVVTVLAVLGVGAGGYWLLRAPATPIETTLPYATSTTTAMQTSDGLVASSVHSSSADPPSVPTGPDGAAGDGSADGRAGSIATQPTTIVVYVAGAVAVPGVYELPVGARVQQAVLAAGGVAVDADFDATNLAAFVDDGDRIFIPRVGQPVPAVVAPTSGGSAGGGPTTSGSSAPAAPLDLNEATADQLDELPGVGPSTAAAIVAHREANGPFASIEALLDVRGIGPAKLDAIRALITV